MVIKAHTKAIVVPTKAFFVRVITRDISLEDCILDLIDNSVDSAWRSQGSQPMGLAEGVDLSKFKIDIKIAPHRFSILDNCGGMTLDDAVNHAFTFGRSARQHQDDFSIGVYGIGMKRAVFKLGGDIRVRSTFVQTDGVSLSFAVPINVNEWLGTDSPPWDFDIVDDQPLPAPGLELSVENLNEEAQSFFDSPAFIQNLVRTIGRDYSLHIARGLEITLNDHVVIGWRFELRQSENFSPLRFSYNDEKGGEPVSVEVIGGMAAPPPDSSDAAEGDFGDARMGWYVLCNGRVVLAADKTSVSGWGTDGWPQWHSQYSGFMGFILFTAADAKALPLTTTKRSVDVSSEVWRRAKPKMRDTTRRWIDYTNDRKLSIDNARQEELRAHGIPIAQIAPRMTVLLPQFTAKPSERMANVNYSVPQARLRKLAKALGDINLTYREVGIRTFDYTYDDIVGED